MLGTDVAGLCRDKGIEAEVLDLPEFDITNQQHLTNALKNTEIIVNCAAYTNVEKAESQEQLAYKVNAEAVGKLGEIAKKSGAWVLHISTDFVFDGTADKPYIETDEANPLSVYGKSKLAGEQELLQSSCECCIVRLEWTYGRAGNNFISKILSRANENDELTVVDDQVGSPTATTEVAKVMLNLVEKQYEGTYHFAMKDYASRYDVAKFILEKLNINVNLKRAKSCDFKTAAQRPLSSKFCCDKIAAVLDEPIKQWQQVLGEYLEQL